MLSFCKEQGFGPRSSLLLVKIFKFIPGLLAPETQGVLPDSSDVRTALLGLQNVSLPTRRRPVHFSQEGGSSGWELADPAALLEQ